MLIDKNKFIADFPEFEERLEPFDGNDLYEVIKNIHESSASIVKSQD